MSEDSIFSKIIRGEIPAHKLYEDNQVVVILDINPLSEGHALVIPKEPSATIDQLSDDASAAVGRVLPRVTRAIKKVTGAKAMNVLQNNGREAGQEVDHVHFHVIPCYPDREAGGLRKTWTPGKLDAEQGAELGRKIARLL
ncbi:MAG: HIT family protein [Phycisphaerales bacterium]